MVIARQPEQTRRSQLPQLVADHPDWSYSQYAATMGVSPARIKQLATAIGISRVGLPRTAAYKANMAAVMRARWADPENRARWCAFLRSPKRVARLCRTMFSNSDPAFAPTRHPSVIDLAWAAGIYEGEGCCSHTQGSGTTAQVVQKDPELLHRLRELFGGRVHWHSRNHTWNWRVYGTRARGFLLTIYPFLTSRRKAQVRRALGVYRTSELHRASA